jgi:hypothetical protein
MPENVPPFSRSSVLDGVAVIEIDANLASRTAGIRLNGKFLRTNVAETALGFEGGSWCWCGRAETDDPGRRARDFERARDRKLDGVPASEEGDATLSDSKLKECRLYEDRPSCKKPRKKGCVGGVAGTKGG